MAPGSGSHNVLKQAKVIILEPNLAKLVGDFECEVVVVLRTRAKRSKPEVVGVGIQHRAQVLLC
jgi:hypothetical protein